MNPCTATAADLAMLTDALDSPSSDIAAMLSGLASVVTRSVPSLVGLSVQVGEPGSRIEISTIKDRAHAAHIRTSLRVPLLRAGRAEATSPMLFVYAAQRGALIDLSADLTWLTGRPLGDACLDEDLDGPTLSSESWLSRLSDVNQAVGVLIGGGLTQHEAFAELDARASATGVEKHLVAAAILALSAKAAVDHALDS